MENNKIIYEVEEIRGSCPVYKVGDKIVIDSQYPVEKLNFKESDGLCMRVTDSMWTRLTWQFGNDELLKHLYGVTGECRIACPMPGKPYTPCGYVIFRIKKEKTG
ncbi:MAG: TIGR04076 family protein [Bacillota bacterium]